MGLDSVELVMTIEETFQVKFPNAVAEKMATVGDVHATVLEMLRARGEAPNPEQVWNTIRDIVVEQIGVRPEEVVPGARFVEDLGID